MRCDPRLRCLFDIQRSYDREIRQVDLKVQIAFRYIAKMKLSSFVRGGRLKSCALAQDMTLSGLHELVTASGKQLTVDLPAVFFTRDLNVNVELLIT